MANERSNDVGKRFAGYTVYDQHYDKIGKVDDLFVDENDLPEYIGVKTGFFGGPSALIPMDIVRVNDRRHLVEVASDKETIENAPSFGDDSEINAEFEDRIYAHFGATRDASPTDRGGYADYATGGDSDVDLTFGQRSHPSGTVPEWEPPPQDHQAANPPVATGAEQGHTATGSDAETVVETRDAETREGDRVHDLDAGAERREAGYGETGYPDEGTRDPSREDAGVRAGAGTTGPTDAGTVGPGMSMGDTETGEFREHDRNVEGVSQPGSDLEDEDELRVQRSEEELRAVTREREAGSVNVRKRVRTDRERLVVPTRREEVTVERVPLSGETAEARIGDDEISVPVVEDEIVVEKRVVAKEEIRVRKDVVHEEQIVEGDVRREEIEIEDDTRHGKG